MSKVMDTGNIEGSAKPMKLSLFQRVEEGRAALSGEITPIQARASAGYDQLVREKFLSLSKEKQRELRTKYPGEYDNYFEE